MKNIVKTLNRLNEIGNSLPEEIVAIYLFGSSITGRLRVESDIDVAILPSYRTTNDERLVLISKVESIIAKLLGEKNIRREVNIVNLRDRFLSLNLQYRIITGGILLYEKDRVERIEFENGVRGEFFDFALYTNLFRKKKYGDLHEKVRAHRRLP